MLQTTEGDWASRISFWIIRFMHDNVFLRRFRNACDILKSMGAGEGQKILEIGCGPGFFTIPAAGIVGKTGRIYALDVNPFAVRHVSKKIEREGLDNAEAMHANAAETGLPERSIDLAFFIGVPHIAGGFQPVLLELNRVMKPEGAIAFHLGRWSDQMLIEKMDRAGFVLSNARGRIRIFRRAERNAEKESPAAVNNG
jgi:ubiquinone/menaquinone biosynthesis C-methylase UbiE